MSSHISAIALITFYLFKILSYAISQASLFNSLIVASLSQIVLCILFLILVHTILLNLVRSELLYLNTTLTVRVQSFPLSTCAITFRIAIETDSFF